MSDIQIEFLSHHRKAKNAPNPKYPDGVNLDLTNGAKVACFADLPYPAQCCGILFVRCRKCGANAAITTAGRLDDPRTVKLACAAFDKDAKK
jgi:hypothetical protein